MPQDAIETRMAEFGLTRRAVELVRSHAPILKTRVPELVDAYYAHLGHTGFADLMRSEHIERLKKARIEHWRLLLDTDFARVAADYAEHFGPRLLKAGFPRSIFVLAAEWFAVGMTRFVDGAPEIPRTIKTELRSALLCVTFLDLFLAENSRQITLID